MKALIKFERRNMELTFSEIAALSGWVALIYSVLQNKRNDNEEALKVTIRIEESIKNINAEFTGFKTESKDKIDTLEEDVKGLRKQVIINEQSTKSAHHRLDRMENIK